METLKLNIKIIPNAPKNSIEGYLGEYLKVKIAAPAVDNKANEELIKYFAKIFDIPKSNIEIIRGEHVRLKVLKLTGQGVEAKIKGILG